MEEFLLSRVFTGNELYVVYQQKVDCAVSVPKLLGGTFLDSVYQFVSECLGGHV
jgi:hypothetical protein